MFEGVIAFVPLMFKVITFVGPLFPLCVPPLTVSFAIKSDRIPDFVAIKSELPLIRIALKRERLLIRLKVVLVATTLPLLSQLNAVFEVTLPLAP
jgi:hypothetical protein